MGFEKGKARSYNVKVTDKTVPIPLREFGDSDELADKMHEYSIKAWLEHVEQSEGIVAIIPPSQLEIQPATPHWIGFGRKKTTVAKVVLNLGSGGMTVNGQPLHHYFRKTPTRANQFLHRLLELASVHEALLQLDGAISVRGSSPTRSRQAKAVAHALARALVSYDPKLKQPLKQGGFGGVRVKRKHLSQLGA